MLFSGTKTDLTIELTPDVIEHLLKFRQVNDDDLEAGGQLFARIECASSSWIIQKCTGPRPEDKRSRFRFLPNRRLEQNEIESAFNEGLHFVGDWHTHPQARPEPSASDHKSMTDMCSKTDRQVEGFLMIIVGNSDIIDLWVSIHRDKGEYERLVLVDSGG